MSAEPAKPKAARRLTADEIRDQLRDVDFKSEGDMQRIAGYFASRVGGEGGDLRCDGYGPVQIGVLDWFG